jgi:hypothetical protein
MPAQPLSFAQRVVGVVLSPGDTFRSVAVWPHWVDVLALQTLVTALAFGVFLSTDAGKAAYVDQAVSSIEAFGGTVTDAMYASVQRQAELAVFLQPATILLFAPLVAAVIAGILLGVFAVLGGEATYRQVLAVVSHAGIVTMLQPLLTLPLNHQQQSMSSATTLAVFVPGLDEGSFVGNLLGFLDLFYIWYAVVLAMGLAAVYRRRPTPIAVGLLTVLVLVGAAIAVVKVALGGR